MDMFWMSKGLIVLAFVNCLCYGFSDHIEAFQNIDDNANACASQCTEDSAANQKSTLEACQRGCRLFSVCEWVSVNLTEVCHECSLACSEAYEEDIDRKAACIAGCNTALPFAEQRHKKLASEESHIHLAQTTQFSDFFPFLRNPSDDERSQITTLDDLMTQMFQSALKSFSRMSNFMSSYDTKILDIDDGNIHEVIIVEYARPEFFTATDKKLTLNTDEIRFKTTLLDHVESNLQTNVNRNIFPSLDETSNGNDLESDNSYLARMRQHARNWWDCFTRKAGLPELVLFIFWASLLLLLVMTCVLPSTAKPKKLSINGDLAYITDSKGDLPAYAQAYPTPNTGKKSLYFLASVVQTSEEKVPLIEDSLN